jgi:hypothetical protein
MSGSTASRDHVYSQNANGARKQAGSVLVSYVPTVRLHAKNGQIFRGSAPSPATASNFRGSAPNPATASSWWDVPAGDVRVPAYVYVPSSSRGMRRVIHLFSVQTHSETNAVDNLHSIRFRLQIV